MTIDNVKKHLDIIHNECIKKKTKNCTWTLPLLQNYYTISHIKNNEMPIGDSNQLVYSGILMDLDNEYNYDSDDNSDIDNNYSDDSKHITTKISNGRYVFYEFDKVYTILTKKYDHDIIGIIEKTKNNVCIKFTHYFVHNGIRMRNPLIDVEKGCKNPIYKNETFGNKKYRIATHYVCSEDSFYEDCYFVTLPFDIKNGTYKGNMTANSVKIKNNKMYINFEKIKDGMYDNENTTHNNIFKKGFYENGILYYTVLVFDLNNPDNLVV
jgi:hypothetical protein